MTIPGSFVAYFFFHSVLQREVVRHDVIYEVRFYGKVVKSIGSDGIPKFLWDGGEVVQAVAHDVPIPGYGTANTINIRLWRSVPKKVNS